MSEAVMAALQQWCQQQGYNHSRHHDHIRLPCCGLTPQQDAVHYPMLGLTLICGPSHTIAHSHYQQCMELIQHRVLPLLVVSYRYGYWESYRPLVALELGDPTLFQQLLQLIAQHQQRCVELFSRPKPLQWWWRWSKLLFSLVRWR